MPGASLGVKCEIENIQIVILVAQPHSNTYVVHPYSLWTCLGCMYVGRGANLMDVRAIPSFAKLLLECVSFAYASSKLEIKFLWRSKVGNYGRCGDMTLHDTFSVIWRILTLLLTFLHFVQKSQSGWMPSAFTRAGKKSRKIWWKLCNFTKIFRGLRPLESWTLQGA